jgi:hypothetical protein
MALGAGIIGDIAVPAERGGFIGLFGLGNLVSACGLRFEKSQTGRVLGWSLSWSRHRRGLGSGTWLEVPFTRITYA